VTYTEDFTGQDVSCHFAVIFASADLVDFDHLGLGGWDRKAIGMAVFLVALPLTGLTPLLPNPAQPFSVSDLNRKPEIAQGLACSLLDSYGVTAGLLASMRGRKCNARNPIPAGSRVWSPISDLYRLFTEALKMNGVQPLIGGDMPDFLIVWNSNLANAMTSSTTAAVLPRRTVIMSIGPALDLPPSQWALQRIWEKGGLVTFSPTFILRSPDKFADIMKMIRCSEHWGAYIIPAVIEWASVSWREIA
jgi:hypothetical protein